MSPQICLFILLLTLTSASRCKSTSRLISINPPALPDPTPLGYTHIRVDTKNLVAYVSGQIPADSEGNLIGTNLQEQLAEVQRKLMIVLDTLQATKDDVIKLNIYVVDYVAERDFPIILPFGMAFGNPVTTGVGADALAFDGMLVEVDMLVAVKRRLIRKLSCF